MKKLQINLPADLEAIRVVGTHITDLLLPLPGLREPDMLIYTIQLAVQEICVNIVTHAYDGIAHGQIQVVMTLDDISRRLVVELIDHGHPFQPELVPAPPLDDIQEHGYGLFLARELLDEVHYEARANTNYWRLSKYL